MSRIEQLPKMWQRPGMYLFDYVRADNASMFAEFIHATYYMSGNNRPQRVRFQSEGEYHVMTAQNYCIPLNEIGMDQVPLDLEGEASFIDWLSKQGVATVPATSLQSCIGLANIVSFTEFCALDISVANEHFRQLFYLGQALSPYTRRLKSELPALAPYVSLWFTLHPAIFKSRTVKVEEVEEALERLQSYIPTEFVLTSKEDHDDGFTMTIGIEKNRSEPLRHTAKKRLVSGMAS